MTKRHGMALIYPAARWEDAFPSWQWIPWRHQFSAIFVKILSFLIMKHFGYADLGRSPGCFRISS